MAKQRITLSLSYKAAKFLRSEQVRRCLPSLSALVEQIAAELQNKAERQSHEQNMNDYYAALSDADIAEGRKWGMTGEASAASDASIRSSS